MRCPCRGPNDTLEPGEGQTLIEEVAGQHHEEVNDAIRRKRREMSLQTTQSDASRQPANAAWYQWYSPHPGFLPQSAPEDTDRRNYSGYGCVMGFFFGVVAFCLFVMAFIGFLTQSAQKTRDGEAKRQLEAAGFHPYAFYNELKGKKGVAIDTGARKIAILNDGVPRIFGYDDLLSVEVKRNGSTVTKTEAGSQVARAAVGGVLLGPVGLLLGGLSASQRSVETIKKLSLKVYTKSRIMPVEELVFLDVGGNGMKESSATERMAERLEEWHDHLKIALMTKEE